MFNLFAASKTFPKFSRRSSRSISDSTLSLNSLHSSFVHLALFRIQITLSSLRYTLLPDFSFLRIHLSSFSVWTYFSSTLITLSVWTSTSLISFPLFSLFLFTLSAMWRHSQLSSLWPSVQCQNTCSFSDVWNYYIPLWCKHHLGDPDSLLYDVNKSTLPFHGSRCNSTICTFSFPSPPNLLKVIF